ncbi:hypothetical protein [Maribacter halichondriae]|uniref:hypothetical protein n=1 Tax=Maribacter halichondriae TaxID=2980554 RepID=UPI002358B5E9|nr:hypothetical protein [Maribacter sp. Hal144]
MREIINTFETEFKSISQKFVIIEEYLEDLAASKVDFIYNPGVYIFLFDNEVIKVGRHLTNSRKRALEHIRDNTENEDFEMSKMVGNKKSKVILLNVKDVNDKHWVAAFEIFLEEKLNPKIRSKRH